MLPFLRGGDILLVRRINPLRAFPGEILLYARHDRLFAHRLREKWWQDGHLVLAAKGDALPYTDAPVSDEECLGLVVAVCRDGRFLNPASRFGRLSVHFLSFLPGGSSWLYWLARLWQRLAPRASVPPTGKPDAPPAGRQGPVHI